MSLSVRRAQLLRHLQIINSIKLSNIYIYFLEKSAASYQGLISKTLIPQLHSVAECDQDISQQFKSENLKCDRLILKWEIQHINKRAQQAAFQILTKKSFCSYKSMWRVCQVAPPAGPAALLSYSSLLYNTQVIDKRLYRHVELIQSFLMWTDQVTNNCFCFYLPAHSLHCCSLISSVFLR